MGITRRGLAGGALAGLGAGLQRMGEARVIRRVKADEDARAQAAEFEKQRLAAFTALSQNVAQHPEQADVLLHVASQHPLLQGVDLGALKPPPALLLRPLLESVNTADSPEKIPADLGAAARARGVNLPSVPLSNFAAFGAQADYADAPPELNALMNTASARMGQLAQGRDREVSEAQRKSEATSYGSTTGGNRATNENFPVKLDQERQTGAQQTTQRLDLEQQLTPVMVDRVGRETTARERAQAAVKEDTATPPAPYEAERSVRNLQSIDALIKKVSPWTAGTGSLLARVPGTEARNFAAELNTLKANIAFSELAAMRAASKTGGALGAISDRELAHLESSLGALDPGQSPENLIAQLLKIKANIARWTALQGVPQGATVQLPGGPSGIRSVTPITKPR